MIDTMLWSYADLDARARFASFVFTGNLNECWIWTGGLEPDGGYGRFRPPGLTVIAAHRWSYLAHHGPTTKPTIRHHCDIRCCVNPHHLTAGTQAANIADTVRRGRWTTTARTGPTSWPTLAYTLRNAARAGARDLIRQLTRRPQQLELWTHHTR